MALMFNKMLSYRFSLALICLFDLSIALHFCISFRNDDESMDQLKDVGVQREDGVMVISPEDDG